MPPRGITLVELLVTLAIVALLGALALPGLRSLRDQSDSTLAVNQLMGQLALARSSAILQHARVSLCPSPGAGPGSGHHPGTNTGCGARDSWHLGALLFIDSNGNGRREPAEAELRRFPPLATGRVYWRAFRNRAYLQYLPNGHTPWQNGSFHYCATSGAPNLARIVILTASGRSRVARDSNGDGVVEDANGQPARCPPHG